MSNGYYSGFFFVNLSEDISVEVCCLCGAIVWETTDHKYWHKNTIKDWPGED